MSNQEPKALRAKILQNLQTEYKHLCTMIERATKFYNEANLKSSPTYQLVKKTLPCNKYSYVSILDEQIENMRKYANNLAERIYFVLDEDRERKGWEKCD